MSAVAWFGWALVIALPALGAPIPSGAAADPVVTTTIYVALSIPRPVGPAPQDNCTGNRGTLTYAPTADRVLRGYGAELRRHGAVTDRFGLGTWAVDARGNDLAFEEHDDLLFTARLSVVERVLPGFLRRMRVRLDQQEALAEIAGGPYPGLARPRVLLDVTVPFARAGYARLAAVHRIFADRGNGGATQYADARGVHVSSGVLAGDAPRIERELYHAGFRPSRSLTTFMTDDAPRCR